MAEGQAGAKRSAWSGKWAFILAGAASAVGLGNMWRFPYLAAKFGGGTFLFTYFVLAFTFGISLLLLETALGRHTKLSAIGAFRHFGKRFAWIGILASLVPFIITPYYCIIGGWVFKYFAAYMAGGASALSDGGTYFLGFLYGPTESYAWMLVFMALVFIIVALGVKRGIEKANRVMMPLLLVMALGLAIYVCCQPGALEGLAYYLIPNFAGVDVGGLILNAMGQMFYSLSLAMGIMITYGSYLDSKESLSGSCLAIAGFDLVVSFIAGALIVPAAYLAMGGAPTSAGPSLMFITLPEIFVTMGGAANVIGVVFFLLVLFAALTSAISLTETCVSILCDAFKWTRKRGMIAAFVVVVVVGIFVNLGYNGLGSLRLFGMEILDFFDFVSNSVLMPIVALLTCIAVGWFIRERVTRRTASGEEESVELRGTDVIAEEVRISAPFRAQKAWAVMVKFVAPVLVVVILVWNLIGVFGG